MENTEKRELHLLKKGRKGVIHMVFSRLGLVIILLLIQVLIQISIFEWFASFLPQFFGGTMAFAMIMVIVLINMDLDATAKITWLVIVMLFPVFGVLLFWFIQSDLGHKVLKKRMQGLLRETQDMIPQSKRILEHFSSEQPGVASLVNYIHRSGCFPAYEHTEVTYFPLGEEKFQRMLVELEQAEHFIFLEYFIIDEGLMWGQILDILARKAAQGVEVRVMYDGTCELALLPGNYPKKLQALGIKCKVFAPIRPVLSTHYNYRDHRKILVIDGHTAFNGGVNLADEYINHTVKYGHWKDTAVMLKGEAVKSFTLMFLQMWNVSEAHMDYGDYLEYPTGTAHKSAGYVLPYGDCPVDNDKVGERVYMDLLNRAQRYVHIMSPYLILDGELETAIKFAAERGVDVSIILPGIPDKKIPYALARTHYAALLDSGVKIYEYTPGFVHAKVCVCDDQEAVVGTINLDYRSLYHHFECATYLNGVDCIADIEQDFVQTAAECKQVSRKTIWKDKKRMCVLGMVVKVIAPLL